MRGVRASAISAIVILVLAPSLLAGSHDYYDPHEIAVFVGGTRYEAEDALTFGAGYEYRWNATAGVGLIFEYVVGDRLTRDYILGIPMYIHPYAGLRLTVAALWESNDEGGDTVSRGAVRAGVAYSLEAGDFCITPEMNFDFRSESAYTIYGIAFGYRF